MRSLRARLRCERGQALGVSLGVGAALISGTLVLGAFGQALGAKGRHQRAADLSAVSAASAMRDAYPRLFEPAYLRRGVRNPRHLGRAQYLALARRAAVVAGERNGVPVRTADVSFPERDSFAPVRVAVSVSGQAPLRPAREEEMEVEVRALAVAELAPDAGGLDFAEGGGYSGPLAHRQGKPMRPDVALAFDRMYAAAQADGVQLIVTSAFRSDAEQARLFAANPNPKWVAPPGQSLHRLATELDLGPRSAWGWLRANARRFGFVQRYSWEPWHFGYTLNAGTRSVGNGGPSGNDGRRGAAIPSFVPSRYAPMISRAAQRWNVSAALLAAQLYAESNFNPAAISPAGAQGIAQFMPATARGYGLDNPFDPEAAINAQARMMRDLLRRFASVPLALAAYNAGPGAVARCACIPPYPETRAYVTKILGLLGAAGAAPPTLSVRLVE